MNRLFLTLSKKQLLIIYKIVVRSHLDYADIIYDKTFNEAFKERLEKVQYSPTLIVTRAIKGTSQKVCTKNKVLNLFVIGCIVN